MSENIEIKARCLDLRAARLKVKKIATDYLGKDRQTDTYFKVKRGRFKLRESELDGAYLVPYVRPDHAHAKPSFYSKIAIANADMIKDLFQKILGILVVVVKRREIFLYDNVRIHLDRVDQLGDFLELEAVLDSRHPDPATEREKVRHLQKILGINEEDLIAESYEFLIRKFADDQP